MTVSGSPPRRVCPYLLDSAFEGRARLASASTTGLRRACGRWGGAGRLERAVALGPGRHRRRARPGPRVAPRGRPAPSPSRRRAGQRSVRGGWSVGLARCWPGRASAAGACPGSCGSGQPAGLAVAADRFVFRRFLPVEAQHAEEAAKRVPFASTRWAFRRLRAVPVVRPWPVRSRAADPFAGASIPSCPVLLCRASRHPAAAVLRRFGRRGLCWVAAAGGGGGRRGGRVVLSRDAGCPNIV